MERSDRSVWNPRGLRLDSESLARGRAPRYSTLRHLYSTLPLPRCGLWFFVAHSSNSSAARNARGGLILMESTELQRLASMGNALRPDWAARSLHTFLERNFAARAYGDVAVALAWVCTRTKTETPRLLLEAGPWWKASATDSAHVQRPPRKDEACPNHPGHWADSCAGCVADRKAGEPAPAEPANPRGPGAVARQHLQQARAELRRARDGGCAHSPQRCRDCSQTDAEEATK